MIRNYCKYLGLIVLLLFVINNTARSQSGTYMGPELSYMVSTFFLESPFDNGVDFFGGEDPLEGNYYNGKLFAGIKINHFLSDKFYFEGSTAFAKRLFTQTLFDQTSSTIEVWHYSFSFFNNWRLNKKLALGLGTNLSLLRPTDPFLIGNPLSSFGQRNLGDTFINISGVFNYFHRGWNLSLKTHLPFRSTRQEEFNEINNFRYKWKKLIQVELSFSYLLKWGWIKELKRKEAQGN